MKHVPIFTALLVSTHERKNSKNVQQPWGEVSRESTSHPYKYMFFSLYVNAFHPLGHKNNRFVTGLQGISENCRSVRVKYIYVLFAGRRPFFREGWAQTYNVRPGRPSSPAGAASTRPGLSAQRPGTGGAQAIGLRQADGEPRQVGTPGGRQAAGG